MDSAMCHKRDQRLVVLSFDIDYAFFYPDISGEWREAYEQAQSWLRDFLAERDLTVTFFFTPQDARLWSDYLRKLDRDGHDIQLHIHDIYRSTPRATKKQLLADGMKVIEDLTARVVDRYRAGMFYVDREVIEILDELAFSTDSSLFPGRHVADKWRSGEHETRYLEFDVPCDYRGFARNPHHLTEGLLVVPPSPYCQGFFRPEWMLSEILSDTADISVLYGHAKNCGGATLKESFGGTFREGMVAVIDELRARNAKFLRFGDLPRIFEFPSCPDILQKLP